MTGSFNYWWIVLISYNAYIRNIFTYHEDMKCYLSKSEAIEITIRSSRNQIQQDSFGYIRTWLKGTDSWYANKLLFRGFR